MLFDIRESGKMCERSTDPFPLQLRKLPKLSNFPYETMFVCFDYQTIEGRTGGSLSRFTG